MLTERQIFKEICENDFSFFVKHYLKIVEPETEFEWNWHIDSLCHYCERLYYYDYKNLDINIPPRMMKSLIVSILFPCWVWAKSPSTKFICASRSYDLSTRFNQRRRDLIESEAYQSLWPLYLLSDRNTAIYFQNHKGGFMKAASAGGKITGEGADILLSDDLLDAMDSYSETVRKTTNIWFSDVFWGRVQSKKKARRLNINQRLHVEDPSGNIAKKHNYHTLVLPMEALEKNPSTVDFVDPRKKGEFLMPDRFGPDEKADEIKALGALGYASQFQQTPNPPGGGIIKTEYIRYYDERPEKFDKTIVTADLKFKSDDTLDYVSFMRWGKIQNRKYLLEFTRGRWSYSATKQNFLRFILPSEIKYIEDKANGPALISDLEAPPYRITGLKPWPAKGSKYMNIDKVQRLKLVENDFELGEVYLPKNSELTPILVEELTSFTEKGSSTGTDDMVDTTTMALIEFKQTETFFFG